MRRLLVALAILAVLSGGAAAAFSDGGPNAQLVHQDRLYGGGGTDPGCFVPDIGFCRQTTTDVAIDAHATGDGHAAYGDIVGRNGQHAEVTCLAVDGNNAVVGARIVSTLNPSQIGYLTLTYYIDNGPGQLDEVSPNYTDTPDPSNWPPGFPYRCPSPDVDPPGFGVLRSFIPISRGNIVIQDGGGSTHSDH